MGHLQILVAAASRPKVVIKKNLKKRKEQSCHQEIVEYQLSIQIQGLF
jgi:hypothetical protein